MENELSFGKKYYYIVATIVLVLLCIAVIASMIYVVINPDSLRDTASQKQTESESACRYQALTEKMTECDSVGRNLIFTLYDMQRNSDTMVTIVIKNVVLTDSWDELNTTDLWDFLYTVEDLQTEDECDACASPEEIFAQIRQAYYRQDTDRLLTRISAKVASPNYEDMCIRDIDWFNKEIAEYGKYFERTYGLSAAKYAFDPEQFRLAEAKQAEMLCKCEEWAAMKLKETAELPPFTSYDYVNPIRLTEIMTDFNYRTEDLTATYFMRRAACVNTLREILVFVRNGYTANTSAANAHLREYIRELAQCAEIPEDEAFDSQIRSRFSAYMNISGVSFLF